MATDVEETIGTGGDHATVALWEDASDDTSLVTADERRIGKLLDEEFSAGNAVLATIAGATVDSTRYRMLKCDTGASFRDNASVQANALRYNAANGAALTSANDYGFTLVIDEDFVRLEGLQVQNNESTSGGVNTGGAVLIGSVQGVYIDFSILEGNRSSTGVLACQNGGVAESFVRNTLVVQRKSAAALIASFEYSNTTVVNCTFVTPSDLTAATNGVGATGSNIPFTNCAFFGATNVATGGTTGFTTCYGDDATPPTGVTTATFADQFENTADATRDFRLKTGANCIDTGTTDATNAPNDIAGTARPSGSAYDVGAWEFVQAAAGGSTRRRFLPALGVA